MFRREQEMDTSLDHKRMFSVMSELVTMTHFSLAFLDGVFVCLATTCTQLPVL